MIIQHVCIENYLPFQNAGNKHVEFSPEEKGVAILGSNGAGKSSLLRLLGPFPAQRPWFGKNGKYELTVSHDNHIYELSSNFESSTAPCSFKKDGEEKNPSGTGDVQKDLVEAEFGLIPPIWDVLSGKIHVCSMAKAARRQLFSSHYPSDLTFVLEYYKKVCSQIRTYSNQMKLLQGREGSYRASLMDPAELKRLSDFRDAALQVIDRIDKINLLLDTEIDQLRHHEVMRHEYHPEDLDGIIYQFHRLRDQYVGELVDIDRGRELGETINRESLSVNYARLNTELQHLERDKTTITTNLQEMRDELNKFANLKYASTDDKKVSLTNELNVIKSELDALNRDTSWTNVPIIPHDKMLDIGELEKEISDLIGRIHSYAGELMGQEQITKLKNDIFIAKNTVATLNREKQDLQEQLNRSEVRLSQITKNSYPTDCSRTCALRATVESSVKELRVRIDNIKERIAYIDKHMLAASTLVTTNQQKLENIAPALPLIKCLWELITDNYLSEIVLNGDDYIECLNTHSSEIINRLRHGIEASKKYHRHKNLSDRYDQISHTLSMMDTVESSQMSAEVINGIIADRERKIDLGLRQMTAIDAQCNKLVASMDRVSNIAGIIRDIESLVKRTEICLNIRLIRNRIEFDQAMIREHNHMKQELSTKLRGIEQTLVDQKKLSDILNSETLPQLELLRKQKAKWEAIEQALSPSKGLPCVYLVRFINRLIALANSYIKEVWCHDMELVYLNEEEDLDFTIQVMMNKCTIVQDLNLCSKGEQAMVDLAMTLAICSERGYLKKYPIKLDEIDGPLTDEHRMKLTQLLGNLLDHQDIQQMFLVSHYASQTGISHCENLVLSSEGIVLPDTVNKNAVIW